MKKLIAIIAIFVLIHPILHAQTTWKIPGYTPDPVRKVMVLAKVTDVTARRQIEDFTVKFLGDKGIQAVQAYSGLKKTKFATREEFLAYADSIEVDALLVYTVESTGQVTETKPTISVGVGVGMYHGFVGASAPIAGGTQVVTTINMKATFYTRKGQGEQWIATMSGKLEGQTDKLAYTLSRNTVKSMVKDGLFLSGK
jgi:hypothetical protein